MLRKQNNSINYQFWLVILCGVTILKKGSKCNIIQVTTKHIYWYFPVYNYLAKGAILPKYFFLIFISSDGWNLRVNIQWEFFPLLLFCAHLFGSFVAAFLYSSRAQVQLDLHGGAAVGPVSKAAWSFAKISMQFSLLIISIIKLHRFIKQVMSSSDH